MAELVQEVKTQPYFKMFMDALKKEGIKTYETENSFQPVKSSLSLDNNKNCNSDTENSLFVDSEENILSEKICNEEEEIYFKKEDPVKDIINQEKPLENSSRRPGLRRHNHARKDIDMETIISTEQKEKGVRGPYKKRKGKRGRPRIKKIYETNDTKLQDELLEPISIKNENIDSAFSTNKQKKKMKQPKDEVKAIEKDATKELMEALMRSAILKGKVASIKPTIKDKLNKIKKKPHKKEQINDEDNEDSPSELLDTETQGDIQKSSHTPRYKYLTGKLHFIFDINLIFFSK